MLKSKQDMAPNRFDYFNWSCEVRRPPRDSDLEKQPARAPHSSPSFFTFIRASIVPCCCQSIGFNYPTCAISKLGETGSVSSSVESNAILRHRLFTSHRRERLYRGSPVPKVGDHWTCQAQNGMLTLQTFLRSWSWVRFVDNELIQDEERSCLHPTRQLESSRTHQFDLHRSFWASTRASPSTVFTVPWAIWLAFCKISLSREQIPRLSRQSRRGIVWMRKVGLFSRIHQEQASFTQLLSTCHRSPYLNVLELLKH